MEMTLRRPHGGEAVLVGIFRSLKQQAVLAASGLGRISGKVEKTEVNWPRVESRPRRRARDPLGLLLDNHAETARQRPEQLQYRNIERDAGGREPDTGFCPQHLVHGGEEVGDVVVL